MSPNWCKVDANLDDHPKIFDAGFWGSIVFQALLRTNRKLRLDGEIPRHCANPAYLARQLNLYRSQPPMDNPEHLMEIGLHAAQRAQLISVDKLLIVIRGWDSDWRGPLTDAERASKYRNSRGGVTKASRAESDASRKRHAERRGEETRGEEKRSPVAATSSRRRGRDRHTGDDVKAGKVGWLEDGISNFGQSSEPTRSLLAQIADERKSGISESVLRETARSLSLLYGESAPAYAYGLEQILLNGDFQFAGKPARIVNYLKSCMRSYTPNAQSKARPRRRDPNNMTGEDLRELRLKLESEGR